MRRIASAKLGAYLTLSAGGSLAALALGRPQLVALVAPFAAYAALGLMLEQRPQISLDAELERERMLEGEEQAIAVRVTASSPIERLELELGPRARSALVPVGPATRLTVRLGAGEQRDLRLTLRATRWGVFQPGALRARARDRFGLVEYELEPPQLTAVRVFPRMETLRALVGPLELQATSGSRVSRDRGEGIEFAEIRPFVPGDRVRRVNWRATARRGTLHVSDRHPERNADVILFLDTFADVADQSGSTLALAVRAAASLAAGYLERKDRVGVVGFGGVLTGLGPRLGEIQLYRILDALLGSEVVFSYAHKDVSFVPRRLLPPKALVIGITPLVDERSVGALLDLRARGFDLAVLDVSPVPFAPPGRSAPDALGHRLWLLRRDALRQRMQAIGIPVTEWRGDQPLQVPLATASEFRRRMRRGAAA